jgi:hypothetical protein
MLACLALAFTALAPRTAAAGAADPERSAIQSVIERAGWLADPFEAGVQASEFGPLRVTSRLHAGPAGIDIAYGGADASGRPASATVTLRRWLTGTLEIRERDARGRDQVVSKEVRDSCARQVTLRRLATVDDPAGAGWHVVTVSALVRLTPSGHASLPLVDLNTRGVSGGFLSVLSDLDELAVLPQTCAVTLPGDSVRVFIGGLDPDAAVCVFAGNQRVTARHRDGSHAEATLLLEGPTGLRQIGVTVFPRRTLADALAPADTRTWVLPILVGTPPPPSQEYFVL